MKNKGFTFIELLLAVAMSSIIALGIGYMMQTSTENYTGVQSEVSLQSDAQIIMNIVTDRLQEGNNVYFDSADHLLTIYYSTMESTGVYPYPRTLVWQNAATGKIYICNIEDEYDPMLANFTDIDFRASDEMEKYLLGEHVKTFKCDQVNIDGLQGENSTTHINIEMAFGDTEYKLENTVKLRNEIMSYN